MDSKMELIGIPIQCWFIGNIKWENVHKVYKAWHKKLLNKFMFLWLEDIIQSPNNLCLGGHSIIYWARKELSFETPDSGIILIFPLLTTMKLEKMVKPFFSYFGQQAAQCCATQSCEAQVNTVFTLVCYLRAMSNCGPGQ